MNRGDIIEIIEFDENSRQHLRRVKVKSVDRLPSQRLRVIGVNMKGRNAVEYRLPLAAATSIEPRPSTIHWVPFTACGMADA